MESLSFPKSLLDIAWEDQSRGCHPTSLLLVGELEVALPVDLLLSFLMWGQDKPDFWNEA